MNWDDIFMDWSQRSEKGLDIVPYPHPALRWKAVPVPAITKDIKSLVDKMFTLMYDRRGIGLAANQCGFPWRIFVMNSTGQEKEKLKELVFINPVLHLPKKTKKPVRMSKHMEGCLSLPGLFREVERPEMVTIEGLDFNGKIVKESYGGVNSRIIQHEYDHLDGILFIDRLAADQQPGVAGWLNYLDVQFESYLENGQLPPIKQLKKNLENLEKFITAPTI